MTWYEGQKKRIFYKKLVLEKYCQNNVTILRQACQIYRREFIEICNIEVFLESFTIASACNKVKKILKPDTIGLIPDGGYSCNNDSKKALMWLLRVEQTDGCRIMHARSGREYRPPELPNYSVEVYCPETKIIYEFLGCFYHGHTCQPFRDVKTMAGDTLAEQYERNMARIEMITQAGYQVKIPRECDFDESDIVNQKPELLTHPIVEQSPLNTREALYVGRTEAMRLHYKARENETIQYVDVMSMYPYICKYSKFPIGHPIIHVEDSCKNKEACLQMNGLIKCSIVPPRNFYHTVLPYRSNNKLLFCLCRSCVYERNISGECKHLRDDERALTGTLVLDEIRLAVEKGYRVLEIYEVYEYQITQYSRLTEEGGLYVDYINTFLKLKAEASGYPSWVRSPEDEERYIQSFRESKGIELDKTSIK